MANSIKIDANNKGVMAGVTDDEDKDIIDIRVDPITNRLKTNIEPLDSSTDSVSVDITGDVFQGYGLYAWYDDDTNFYAMYQDASDKWILMKIVNSTGVTTYATGDSGTSTAWTNRASQTFNDYATTF